MNYILLLSLLLTSCATKPGPAVCPDASETVSITKEVADKILGKVGPFMTDAQITQEHGEAGATSIWRFTNMPSDSVYYRIGLREGDAIWKTNQGVQKTSINLISHLAGIPSATTNCLYVRDRHQAERVIKIKLEEK